MDAEDQPADTDKMKEQVVVGPVLSPSFLLFVSPSITMSKKIVVTTFIFPSFVSLFLQQMRAQFLIMPLRMLSL